MVGKTAYVSGKGDYSPKADFPDKVKNCLNEIRKTLQMGGLDMRHCGEASGRRGVGHSRRRRGR